MFGALNHRFNFDDPSGDIFLEKSKADFISFGKGDGFWVIEEDLHNC